MQGSTAAHYRSRIICRTGLFASVVLTIALGAPLTARAQAIVFDPSNYSQNLLTAARALQQINNQLKSLENQALLLIHSTRNLTSLPASVAEQLKAQLDDINRLTAQANGLAFEVERTSRQLETLYPRQYTAAVSSDRMLQDATARSTNSYEALRQTLLTQSKVTQAISTDTGTLQNIMTASSGAVGALQAQQAGNELAGLHIKQSLQLQTLLLAQGRADAARAAEQQAAAEAARERFTRFIGDGRAYSGH